MYKMTLMLICLMMLLGCTIFYCSQSSAQIESFIAQGQFTQAQKILEEKIQVDPINKTIYINQIDLMHRISLDFSKSEKMIFDELQKKMPDATFSDIARWRDLGVLEARKIDDEWKYFNRAVRNLYRLSPEARNRCSSEKEALGDPGDAEKSFQYSMYIKSLLDDSTPNSLRQPIRYQADYTVTVDADAVPKGETVRCWMPFPRECMLMQDVAFLSSDPEKIHIASNDRRQRTLYLEQEASGDQKTVFKATFQFSAYAHVLNVNSQEVKPYDQSSELYQKFTSEKVPHLILDKDIKTLAGKIVGDEKNPYLKAKNIFEWMDSNITYTSALEYSTIPNLSRYCLDNRRGDCGIQAMLFIALCRASGIPAKWQSGWSLLPDRENLHDWAQFYVEPYGWLCADPSRGLRRSDDERVRWFFFGNIDAFRMVANDDFSEEFEPVKKYLRSEPTDNQRGEVEWPGGNIYYDQWKYERKIIRMTNISPFYQ